MRYGSVATAALCISVAMIACGDDSSGPRESGDKVIVDVDATDQPPQGEFDGPADSLFSPLDGPYGTLGDAGSVYASCAACACGAGTFCFGGGRGYSSLAGTCPAGAPSQGGLAPGCVAMPPACANEPDCNCLLGALSQLSCYPICSESNGFVVYCP